MKFLLFLFLFGTLFSSRILQSQPLLQQGNIDSQSTYTQIKTNPPSPLVLSSVPQLVLTDPPINQPSRTVLQSIPLNSPSYYLVSTPQQNPFSYTIKIENYQPFVNVRPTQTILTSPSQSPPQSEIGSLTYGGGGSAFINPSWLPSPQVPTQQGLPSLISNFVPSGPLLNQNITLTNQQKVSTTTNDSVVTTIENLTITQNNTSQANETSNVSNTISSENSSSSNTTTPVVNQTVNTSSSLPESSANTTVNTTVNATVNTTVNTTTNTSTSATSNSTNQNSSLTVNVTLPANFECCTQVDSGKCTACDTGCYLYQSRCYNPRLCSIWDASNNCLQCIEGYILKQEWCVKA